MGGVSWAQSLIRISTFEVEELQKRVREVEDRRGAARLALVALDREAEEETLRAAGDAQAGWYMIGYKEGLRARRSKVLSDLLQLDLEAQGARDALAHAFESQKKYEHVAEAARVQLVRETAKREGAALDELALRRAG